MTSKILSEMERADRVKEFQKACAEANFQELTKNVFELKGPFSKTLTICTLIHGNEIGGIEVFIKLLEMIRTKEIVPKTNLRMILGNVPAYFVNKRFLESDMNRSFGLDKHQTQEELRASELEKFLRDSDILIDIHQTIGPTNTPFFVFEFDKRSYNFARYLHPELPIVTSTKMSVFKGKTSTSYLIGRSGMAVTIETGQMSIDETQISLGLEITRKAIGTDFEKDFSHFRLVNTYTFCQVIINPDKSLELVREFRNFDTIQKNELLAMNSTEKVHSEVDGIILFPKYGAYAQTTAELALILKPHHEEDNSGKD